MLPDSSPSEGNLISWYDLLRIKCLEYIFRWENISVNKALSDDAGAGCVGVQDVGAVMEGMGRMVWVVMGRSGC